MHKIAPTSLLLLTLSIINNLNGCHTRTTFTVKTITQNPPAQNMIAEVVKNAVIHNNSKISFSINRTFLNAARIDTCLTYNDILLNPEQYQNIKKIIGENKNLYIVAQQKNSPNTALFKIEHKGRPLK